MKFSKFLVTLAFLSSLAFSQTTPPPSPTPTQFTNIYAAGISYSNGASPAVAGTALFAHAMTDASGTYAFTVADVLPNSTKPFTVTTNLGAGVAQKAFAIGNVGIYIPTAAGISINGSNTGWAWSTGALASIPLKGSFRVMPGVRVIKSSVSNGTGYQPVVSLLFGWGK